MWRVTLNGVDITARVAQVSVAYAAENVAGECTVELADRSVLDGIVVPRVPREKLISVDKGDGSAAMSFFLESIDYPQDLTAKTATIWGRSDSARLYLPWAQKISKQWQMATTVDAIVQELADLCGVTVTVAADYDIGAYAYAVSDQYPSEILQDLATKSGQILWPQTDGSLVIAPRVYPATGYGTPDVTLDAAEIKVESVTREVPDFGNRILVSGDTAVAGLSVQVVPLADEDACVVADGTSQVRLIAIVTGADGEPVATGTQVDWSASSGLMSAETSLTQSVVRQGETHQADNYTHVTLDLPAESVVGVYARRDVRRARNLYTERGGSVSGRVITFSAPLDFYDQALIVDYTVKGAPITWTAGWVPGDVTVLASVAGAQGYCTIHQSNPTACATQISFETSPASPCLGDTVSILLKTVMFGGAGIGSAVFGINGCGTLSSTRKTLAPREITETLRTSIWGGAVEVRLSAVPAAGTTPSVVLTETPGADLYDSHDGQTVILSDDEILPGTQVDVTYVAGGTALIAWLPSGLPSGHESITETLSVVHVGEAPDTVAQVTLSRTPVAAPSCIPLMEITDFYASHDGKVVTLLEDGGVILPVGTQVQCAYQSVWQIQPGCSAIITAKVADGSEDGGFGQIAVTARDCRVVNPTETYDPEDPTQIPDETTEPGETGEHDPTSWLQPEEEGDISATSCLPEHINARTPVINTQNRREVFGVPSVENCGETGGVCTCDEICTALRNSGRLSTEGNMTYSTCMAACAETRDAACSGCTLTGPTVLNPGATGVWVDGKTNSGELKGQLDLVSRTFEGYTLRMPSGGSGPFVIQVCYGEDARTCCEAQVNFPPCTLTGPSSLEQGEEGVFVPSLGMTGVSAIGDGMTIVRTAPEGIVAKLNADVCEGSITAIYGGMVCGTKTVTDSYASGSGVVVGPDALDPGDSAYYAHDLGASAEYTGTLELLSSSSGGAILRMPEGASGSYSASWTGRCGVVGSMAVKAFDECWEEGEVPEVGMYLPVVNNAGWHPYYRIGSYKNTAGYGGQPAGCGYSASAIIGNIHYYTEWECVYPPTHRIQWNITAVAENPCE